MVKATASSMVWTPERRKGCKTGSPDSACRSVSAARTIHEPLPDLQAHSASLVMGQPDVIDDVAIHVDIEHPRISDLVVTLTPPSSTKLKRIVLHDHEGGAAKNLVHTYDLIDAPGLADLRGKSAKGTWKLTVESQASQGEGVLHRFGVEYNLHTAQ